MLISIDDVRIHARRNLPAWFFDYVEGGAYSETTLRRNRAGFDRYAFLPRVLQSASRPDLSVQIMGMKWAMPVMPGPVGFCGLVHAGGEVLTARVASACGVPMGLSTFSIAPMEDVARATDPARIMLQLYVLKNRDIMRDLLVRARACGIGTLVLTVDTTVTPMRERDARNGFRGAGGLSLRQLVQMAGKPRWFARIMRHGQPQIGNIIRYNMGRTLFEQAANIGREMDPDLSWTDLAWLRDNWQGKLVVKGILHPDDAVQCAQAGVDGIVVSNHGGRQMDGALSTIEALPAIAAAVRARMTILLDGGVRYGTDVVKALALGAHGVMIGRPYVYGLAANGEQGVVDVLDYFADGIRSSLTLLGISTVNALHDQSARYMIQS